MRKGDNVALLARNSLDWALVDFALAHIGAVGVPVYASSSARDVGYLLEHSGAVGIVCEDAEQLAKVEAVTEELPALQHVLTYHDLDGLAAHGTDYAAANPTALDDATDAIGEDDLFTIIYTSGTTGPPKGCMLSNRNYYVMASVVDRMEETYYHPDDVMLLYLPLAHNYGRLMLLLGAHVGFTIAFLADPLRVAEALPQVRPTLLPSVPRVYEKVHSAVLARFDAATGTKRRLIDWALPIGREVSRLQSEGKPVPAGLRAKHRVADRLVFSKVREPFGGRLRMPGSGGAPLAKEIIEFFDAIGIRISEGYGLTECTTARQHEQARPLPLRLGGPCRSRASRSGSPTTARSRCARRPSSRATTRSPRRRLPCSGPTAGSRRATSACSTRTASCTSPTARRTSSSPPAARTSRPRTSRTT